jgi:hypothetical protein
MGLGTQRQAVIIADSSASHQTLLRAPILPHQIKAGVQVQMSAGLGSDMNEHSRWLCGDRTEGSACPGPGQLLPCGN